MKRIPVVRVVRERIVPYDRAASMPADVAALLGGWAEEALAESMWVLCLNGRNHVIALAEVSRGGVAAAAVTPADVFRPAVVAGATAAILAHNHPSGDPTPSEGDRAVTRAVIAAGRVLGIPLLDHVIVCSSDVYYSFADRGLLQD